MKKAKPKINFADGEFVKSRRSHGGKKVCVEVARRPGEGVGVRDSKDRKGPVLQFTPEEWKAFVAGVKDGEFDI